MRILSKLTGGIAAVALIGAAASPAAARGWGWDGYRHHHDDTGAIVGALVGVGLIAAIAAAASSSSNKQSVDHRYDGPPPPPYDGPRGDDRYGDPADRGDDGARYDNRSNDPRYDDARGDRAGQDAAVDACVVAARDEASRSGGFAEVRGVTSVDPLGNGWDVSGRVEQRSSYRAASGAEHTFRCAWQNGQVSAVSLN